MFQTPTMLSFDQLTFAAEVADVKAFSLTRGLMQADDPYSAINLCHYTGDKPLHVTTGRAMLCDRLHIEPHCLVMPRQTHGCEVAVIDDRFMQLPQAEQQKSLEGIDALVTPLTGVCIGVNTADCVPIVMADPLTWLIAAADHAIGQ